MAGAQQGLDLIARCLLDPGDTVLIDRPGYLGAIQTFRSAGANLVGWDMERADPDELEDLILRYRPKLLYTNPTYQNPTGRTLPLDVRHDCCGWPRAIACRSWRTIRTASSGSTGHRRRRCSRWTSAGW